MPRCALRGLLPAPMRRRIRCGVEASAQWAWAWRGGTGGPCRVGGAPSGPCLAREPSAASSLGHRVLTASAPVPPPRSRSRCHCLAQDEGDGGEAPPCDSRSNEPSTPPTPPPSPPEPGPAANATHAVSHAEGQAGNGLTPTPTPIDETRPAPVLPAKRAREETVSVAGEAVAASEIVEA